VVFTASLPLFYLDKLFGFLLDMTYIFVYALLTCWRGVSLSVPYLVAFALPEASLPDDVVPGLFDSD
jgi:hypothetical protein